MPYPDTSASGHFTSQLFGQTQQTHTTSPAQPSPSPSSPPPQVHVTVRNGSFFRTLFVLVLGFGLGVRFAPETLEWLAVKAPDLVPLLSKSSGNRTMPKAAPL